MQRMPISAETAVKLAAFMKVPLEHLMHMPKHVMLQKLAEMAMADAAGSQSAKIKDGPESGKTSE
ncbi:YycC family protein [Cohnella sp. CFH 77786]|uniref:YycC family protein n=1 Tax=Cohnella sp. CFH 77786 TaxID=2662265 RepID=UPI001C6080C2|nr:YycC family protein [Cohnella sp. CFH 77786]MBW5444765.1 YycC family protein [Cohnella sp. CFH 77786]